MEVSVVKMLVGTPRFQIRVLGLSPDPNSDPASCYKASVDAAGDGSSTWLSATHVLDSDHVWGYWLQRGLILAVKGIWGVNQIIEDLSLWVFLLSLFSNKSKNKFFFKKN